MGARNWVRQRAYLLRGRFRGGGAHRTVSCAAWCGRALYARSAGRPVKESEMREADEVWIASATRNVSSVTRIDDRPVGSGKPGPLWARMWEGFSTLQRELAGQPW